MMKNKKIWMILGMLALLTLGSTVAYFQKSESIGNRFKSAEAKIYLNEKFNPNDRWVPGEEKQKEVRFGNDGKVDSLLRVRFTPILKTKDGKVDEEAAKDFKLNFADNFLQNWTKKGEWYYYNKVLSSSQMTDITLKSVIISDEIGNDEHGISKDYSQASYDVKIEGELIQASYASEASSSMEWGLTPTITNKQVSWSND